MKHSYSIVQFMPDRVSRNAVAVGVLYFDENDGKVYVSGAIASDAYIEAVADLFGVPRETLASKVRSSWHAATHLHERDEATVDKWIASLANDIQITPRRPCAEEFGGPCISELLIPGLDRPTTKSQFEPI